MASTCIESLDICAIRVSKLNDPAGSPLTGAGNGYVSVNPQDLKVTVDVTKGTSKDMINGCGALAATFTDPDQIKAVTLALNMCQLDADLMSIMTGASEFSSGGNAIGFQLPAVGSQPPLICFEAWSRAWDKSHQAVVPFTTPSAAWIHWVFPGTRWVQGDLTMQHDLMVVPVNGTGQENTAITANGPFDDWPAAVAAAGGITRIGGWFYDATIPTNATCTSIAVTSAVS